MYQNNIFNDLIKLIDKPSFQTAVSEHNSDKYSRCLHSWCHLIVMVFSQLRNHSSLRELELSFNSKSNHHYHLNCNKIHRSTLADANQNRNPEIFKSVASNLCKRMKGLNKKELEVFLRILDSSPIYLSGFGYDEWSMPLKTRCTQGLKLHAEYDSDLGSIVDFSISGSNKNDISVAIEEFEIEAGHTYVFDKGYCDYNWWWLIEKKNAKFVTRLKRNASILVEEERPVNDVSGHIISDDIVRFKNKHPRGGKVNEYESTMRRVTVARPDKDTDLVLITNDKASSPEKIAELYKKRWEIELYFKWIKTNLKIKKFLGRSKNAVIIQIYAALIAFLLVALYQKMSDKTRTLRECLIYIRENLFTRTYLEELHHKRRRITKLKSQQKSFQFS